MGVRHCREAPSLRRHDDNLRVSQGRSRQHDRGRRAVDELRIGWLGPHEWGGEVGITLLPGRNDLGPGGHTRDLDSDIGFLTRSKVRALLILSDDNELEATRTVGLVSKARSAGIHVIRRPVRRRRLPSLPAVREIVKQLDAIEGNLVITCRTGLGRSGAIGATWLMDERRFTKDEAVGRVRTVRSARALSRREYEFLLERYAMWRDSGTVIDEGAAGPAAIPNYELTLAAVPETDAPYGPINRFAFSFNGYAYIRSLGNYAALIQREMGTEVGYPDPSMAFPQGLSLSDYRALLFLFQRDHHDDWPGPDEVEYAQRLVGEIRRILREGRRL